jgi:hypothetical protein
MTKDMFCIKKEDLIQLFDPFMVLHGKKVKKRCWKDFLDKNTMENIIMDYPKQENSYLVKLRFRKIPCSTQENIGKIEGRYFRLTGMDKKLGIEDANLSKNVIHVLRKGLEWLENDELQGVDEWFDYWDSLPFIEGSC